MEDPRRPDAERGAHFPTGEGARNGTEPYVDDAQLSVATVRQPIDTLGPRAQRTINRIVEATREVLLARGYAGTTIDEIARVAQVSRPSFYTYFPSKREVMLVVGEQSARQSGRVVEQLDGRTRTRAAFEAWVTEYFDFLDVHGSLLFAWTEAAREDHELLVAGMHRHLAICRRFGEIVVAPATVDPEHATVIGLTAMSTLERVWNYSTLYTGAVDRGAAIAASVRSVWGFAGQFPRRGPAGA